MPEAAAKEPAGNGTDHHALVLLGRRLAAA
jgi:hypothetical protein